MRRRNLIVGAGAALAAPAIIGGRANAQSASALGTTLTPTGADPTASADGLVSAYPSAPPAMPAGWVTGQMPNPYGGDQPIFTVTPDNMSKYSDMLSDGQKLLLTRFGAQGFKMNVYPCRRGYSVPKFVADNTALNVTRAQPGSGGLHLGIQNTAGGVPFPIPSTDPNVAGLQVMWNHATRYQGQFENYSASQIICSQGANVLALTEHLHIQFPYYMPDVTPATYDGLYYRSYLTYTQPANQVGGQFNAQSSTDLTKRRNTAYEYLVGEGRIREAPDESYDIPATQANDAVNVDEIYVFQGAFDRYNWKLLGKKEMIVPYNIYDLSHAQPDNSTLGTNFPNPDLVRWEVHRCHVVEATLAPGKRHSMPHRVMYVDEDIWCCLMSDGWDAQGNYWRYNMNLPQLFQSTLNVPAYLFTGQVVWNFQSNQYVVLGPWWNAPAPMGQGGMITDPIPASTFDTGSMSASGGL
jgi:hypothetical protein